MVHLLLDLILSFAAHHRGGGVFGHQQQQQQWCLYGHHCPGRGGLPGRRDGSAGAWHVPVIGGPSPTGSPRPGNKMRHVLLYASLSEALGGGLVTIRFY